jgi:hypothetical protein
MLRSVPVEEDAAIARWKRRDFLMGTAMISMQRSSPYGGVCEWLKQTVLKTVIPQGIEGSNPSASANFWNSKLGRRLVSENVSGSPFSLSKIIV